MFWGGVRQADGTAELLDAFAELAKFYVPHYLQSKNGPIQSSSAFGSHRTRIPHNSGLLHPVCPAAWLFSRGSYRARRQTSTHPHCSG